MAQIGEKTYRQHLRKLFTTMLPCIRQAYSYSFISFNDNSYESISVKLRVEYIRNF